MHRLAAVLLFGGVMLGVAWSLKSAHPSSEVGAPAEHDGLPPLISLRDLYANAEATWSYKISPDGQKLGWIATHEAVATVHYRKLGEHAVRTIRTDEPIKDFWWTQDSRRIFFNREMGSENWHLFMADTESPDAPYVNVTRHANTTGVVHQVFPHDPAHILITNNLRDPKVFDFYRVNLDSGEFTLLDRNPGDVTAWITTPKGGILGRQRGRGTGGWTVELRREDGSWEPSFSGAWDDHLRIVRYPPDPRKVWALSNRGRDKIALVQLDLETGSERVVFEDPRADVEGAWVTREGYELRSAWSFPDLPVSRFYDAEDEADIESFRKDGPAIVWLTSESRDRRRWTVGVATDTGSYSWWLLDRDSDERTLLAEAAIARYRDRFSSMKPISFTARDGLEIPGYLTIPRGSSGKDLPLVLHVHGGPWWRHRWGFDREAQFLANRGYAVLQVNYRGSRGFGRRFMQAAIGEFGGRMQDDLVDAVQWAVAEGIADPKRIAIYGWDYGGYAALMGLALTPKLFAAGVDASGVVDWASALETLPPYWDKTLYHTYLGNPSKPEDLPKLRARSPLSHVQHIVRPLLVVEGANDVRGMEGQAERLLAALREQGAPVEHLLFPDEGHWIQKWQNNVRFHRKLENFLAAHLGGRVSAYDAVEVWLELQ